MLAMDDFKKLGAMLPKTIAVYEKSDGHVYVLGIPIKYFLPCECR